MNLLLDFLVDLVRVMGYLTAIACLLICWGFIAKQIVKLIKRVKR